MNTAATRFTVAAAQLPPAFLDRKATVASACTAIGEAAKNGARLVVFPEAFISAYPDWIWVVPGNQKPTLNELYAKLVDTAVTIPDDATDELCRAARAAKVHVAIGMNERNREASNASVYNTLLFIDDKGSILGKHRKMMPTGCERTVWAMGDGSTLDVYDTPFGKLGGLICWENYMPLARAAMYSWGTQILAASTWDSSEAWRVSLQHIAREGGMYVIGCAMGVRMDDIPDEYEFKKLYPEDREWVNQGNSCVVDPNGQFVAGPLNQKQEILYADIDLSAITKAKWIFDAAGHYARPDVFELVVNRKPNPMAREIEEP
jgi:nitrilase